MKGLLGFVVVAMAALLWVVLASGVGPAAPELMEPTPAVGAGAVAAEVEVAAAVSPAPRLPARVETSIAAPRAASLSGVVRFADGSPVRGAQIVVVDAVDPTGAALAVTDARGRFTTAPTPDAVGPWTVLAEWFVYESEGVVVRDPGVPVELSVPVPPKLRGRVVGPAGAPVAAKVRLFRCGAEIAEAHEFRTEHDGTFVLVGVAPGRWGVLAEEALGRRHAVYAPSSWTEVVVGDGCAWVELQLRRREVITGVVRWDDGRPCEHARVWASPVDWEDAVAATGIQQFRVGRWRGPLSASDLFGRAVDNHLAADGRFELRVGPASAFDVRCEPPRAAGGRSLLQENVAVGSTVRFVVPRLDRSGRAVVEFVHAGGAPALVRSASAGCYDDGKWVATAEVDLDRARGLARLSGLVPGADLRLRARVRGSGVGEWGPWPVAGGVVQRRILIPAPGVIEVTTMDRAGDPHGHQLIEATREAPNQRQVRTTNARGQGIFDELLPGIWSVRRGDGEGPIQQVVVPEGGRGVCRLVW
ncbi:MAG: carboxypeptidase-like regulatory domain-containing protein [Planctomycetota bacterium]